MLHIVINTSYGEEVRGKASNIDELLKLLKPKEIKKIFDHDAYAEIKHIFNNIKKLPGNDTYMEDINGFMINYISNGYEITTLVFYF